MDAAKTFADNLIENTFRNNLFKSPNRFSSEVSFDVTYNGKTYRTKLDGIGWDGNTQKYVAIECKMGSAVLSENQEAFFNALKNGGVITPVAGKASDVFLINEIGMDVRAKFANQWYRNENLINY